MRAAGLQKCQNLKEDIMKAGELMRMKCVPDSMVPHPEVSLGMIRIKDHVGDRIQLTCMESIPKVAELKNIAETTKDIPESGLIIM